jgi:hypothetical protein
MVGSPDFYLLEAEAHHEFVKTEVPAGIAVLICFFAAESEASRFFA